MSLGLALAWLLGVPGLPIAGPGPVGAQEGAGSNSWTFRGPCFNTAAREAPHVDCLAFDPRNPNTVYAGTQQGVYRSIDSGENWEPRNQGLGGYGDLVITGLTIDPADSQRLTISTWGYGLFRSSNGGGQWTRLADPLRPAGGQARAACGPEPPPVRAGGYSASYGVTGGSREGTEGRMPGGQRPQIQRLPMPLTWTPVRSAAVNPSNRNEILACIDNGFGLYRSLDGGQSWSRVDLDTTSAWSYAFAPSNSRIRYVSFGSTSADAPSASLYRSLDGGSNWTRVGASTISEVVFSITIHPTNPSIVFAATLGAGMFRSTDGGNTWTQVGGLSDSFIFRVALAPSNPSVAYAGGWERIFRSSDGGANWSVADTSYPIKYVQGVAIHPTQPETVLVGGGVSPWGGVYKRTAPGSAFALTARGMDNTFVLDIEQDPLDPNILYAATWGGSIFRSNDGGATWAAKNTCPYVYAIEAVREGGSVTLYAGTFYADTGVLKSSDRGDHWTEISHGYNSDISFDILAIGGDPKRLVAATYWGVQYSSDGGQTWATVAGLGSGIVLHLAEFRGNGGLLAATYGGGIYYSSNGMSWSPTRGATADAGCEYIFDVVCSPSYPGVAYAAGLGIFRTTDYGAHWQAISTGLPNEHMRAVDVVPGSGDVFATANLSGVYLAANGGPLWKRINTGLTELRVRALKVVSSSPVRVFAGTNGAGAWDYTLTSRPVVRRRNLPVVLWNSAGSAPTSDRYEPNDSRAQAYTLPGPGTYYSYIWTDKEQDWYRFDVRTLGRVSVDLSGVPGGGDYDLYLCASDGMLIALSISAGNQDEHIDFQPAQPGDYYLLVDGYAGSSRALPYRLKLDCNGYPGSGQISGTVRQRGNPAISVPVRLLYDNGCSTTEVTTLTDGSGIYRFRGMPSLADGQGYRVVYSNLDENVNRLASWDCNWLTQYNAGQSAAGGSFDIGDVVMITPADEATVGLPATFTWSRRNVPGDSYWLRLRYIGVNAGWWAGPLGDVGQYRLTQLPSGFTVGNAYRWELWVDGNDGEGQSLYWRSVTFSNSGAIAGVAGAGKPSLPVGMGKDASWAEAGLGIDRTGR